MFCWPARDKDPRACNVIYDPENQTVEYRRVAWDVFSYAKQIFIEKLHFITAFRAIDGGLRMGEDGQVSEYWSDEFQAILRQGLGQVDGIQAYDKYMKDHYSALAAYPDQTVVF